MTLNVGKENIISFELPKNGDMYLPWGKIKFWKKSFMIKEYNYEQVFDMACLVNIYILVMWVK